MILKANCPGCFNPIEYDPVEIDGGKAPCPHCQREIIFPKQRSHNQFAPPVVPKVPEGLTCPFCKSTSLSLPTEKINSTGRALIIVGLVFAVLIVGLIFILVGMRMKETKYQCFNCKKWF